MSFRSESTTGKKNGPTIENQSGNHGELKNEIAFSFWFEVLIYSSQDQHIQETEWRRDRPRKQYCLCPIHDQTLLD